MAKKKNIVVSKYDSEIFNARLIRDKALITELTSRFDFIRDKALLEAMKIANKSDGNTEWFTERAGRTEKFAKDLNTTLRPEYLKKDAFIKEVYAEEYRTAYFESLYQITNLGIDEGYLVSLPRYTKQQFKKAIEYPLSKLSNLNQMKTSRSVDIEQLFRTVVSGVEQGLSLPKINRNIDIALGYRDAAGKWIADIEARRGQTYKSMRVLRTEVLRIRSTAELDQWKNQQPFVPSKLVLLSVLDNRTRPQSARMDNQISNKDGKFLYPDGNYYYPHRTGVARWDINDRETTITQDPEFPPDKRIQRDPKTGEATVKPFEDFESYAKKNNLVRNKYGEYLFR